MNYSYVLFLPFAYKFPISVVFIGLISDVCDLCWFLFLVPFFLDRVSFIYLFIFLSELLTFPWNFLVKIFEAWIKGGFPRECLLLLLPGTWVDFCSRTILYLKFSRPLMWCKFDCKPSSDWFWLLILRDIPLPPSSI